MSAIYYKTAMQGKNPEVVLKCTSARGAIWRLAGGALWQAFEQQRVWRVHPWISVGQ